MRTLSVTRSRGGADEKGNYRSKRSTQKRRHVLHVLTEALFALFAGKHHLGRLQQLVVCLLCVALGAVEPPLAARRAHRDLRIEYVLTHGGALADVAQAPVTPSPRVQKGRGQRVTRTRSQSALLAAFWRQTGVDTRVDIGVDTGVDTGVDAGVDFVSCFAKVLPGGGSAATMRRTIVIFASVLLVVLIVRQIGWMSPAVDAEVARNLGERRRPPVEVAATGTKVDVALHIMSQCPGTRATASLWLPRRSS